MSAGFGGQGGGLSLSKTDALSPVSLSFILSGGEITLLLVVRPNSGILGVLNAKGRGPNESVVKSSSESGVSCSSPLSSVEFIRGVICFFAFLSPFLASFVRLSFGRAPAISLSATVGGCQSGSSLLSLLSLLSSLARSRALLSCCVYISTPSSLVISLVPRSKRCKVEWEMLVASSSSNGFSSLSFCLSVNPKKTLERGELGAFSLSPSSSLSCGLIRC